MKTPYKVRVLEGETTQQANNRQFNFGLNEGYHAQKNGRKPDWKKGEHPSPHYEDGFWIGFKFLDWIQ